jgi:hypothetical protein
LTKSWGSIRRLLIARAQHDALPIVIADPAFDPTTFESSRQREPALPFGEGRFA